MGMLLQALPLAEDQELRQTNLIDFARQISRAWARAAGLRRINSVGHSR